MSERQPDSPIKDNAPTSYELLVPENFAIDVARDMFAATNTHYPGYPTPAERLHMTIDEIALWQRQGARTVDLPSGYPIILDHPNYLRGIAKNTAMLDDGVTDFHDVRLLPSFSPEGYERDERGLPIRPNDELFLQLGAIGGFGFYRQYGPNRAADPVVLREVDGTLQALVIVRTDTGLTALAGGMEDKDEPSISAATRELFEEANVDLVDTPSEIIYQGPVWSDTRSTRNAWAETTVVLLMPETEKTDQMIPVAGSDARRVLWMDVTQDNLQQENMFVSHAGFIKMGVATWQERSGRKVSKDGAIHDQI